MSNVAVIFYNAKGKSYCTSEILVSQVDLKKWLYLNFQEKPSVKSENRAVQVRLGRDK
jgi:hypothetical protein